MTSTSWNKDLVDQIDWHWVDQARPRLDGLTDTEYLWEPVHSWSVRPRGTSHAPMAVGAADWTIDWGWPPPDPAPFTTIAWRLAHVILTLGARNASHFGGPPAEYPTWTYAGTAEAALEQLDEQYARWVAGVRSLGEDGLDRLCGPAEGPYAESTMGALVLHMNRELIHHLSEVACLRDLYAHWPQADTSDATDTSDSSNATDTFDATDTSDATHTSNATDTSDTSDATGTPDTSDTSDVSGPTETQEP